MNSRTLREALTVLAEREEATRASLERSRGSVAAETERWVDKLALAAQFPIQAQDGPVARDDEAIAAGRRDAAAPANGRLTSVLVNLTRQYERLAAPSLAPVVAAGHIRPDRDDRPSLPLHPRGGTQLAPVSPPRHGLDHAHDPEPHRPFHSQRFDIASLATHLQRDLLRTPDAANDTAQLDQIIKLLDAQRRTMDDIGATLKRIEEKLGPARFS